MAREIIREPFLSIESDLVFDMSLLDDMLYPDRIAIARMQPWMNGTTVTVNRFQEVKAFRIDTAGAKRRRILTATFASPAAPRPKIATWLTP